ncbi:MAG: CHAT domain-containing protein [Methylococcales bacterium]|nr:CHAT domain-containing protein [Methylococcales bacterium]MBT7410575.1 CHAT domain-containing protein [Methylococcales bacterium]
MKTPKWIKHTNKSAIGLLITGILVINQAFATDGIKQADQYFQQGQLTRAAEIYQQILPYSTQADKLFIRLFNLYIDTRVFNKAEELLNNPPSQITTKLNQQTLLISLKGQLLFHQGKLKQAETTLKQAIELAQVNHLLSIEISASSRLASVYFVSGELDKATQYFNDALNLMTPQTMPAIKVATLINLTRVHLFSRQFQQARDSIQQAQLTLNTQAEHRQSLNFYFQLDYLIQQLPPANQQSQLNQRVKLLQTARLIAKKRNNQRAESNALGKLAQLYSSTSQLNDALLLNNQATHLAHQVTDANLLYQWYWQAGKILKQQNQIDLSINAYLQGVHYLQQIRGQWIKPVAGINLSFRQKLGALYFELADLLLSKARQTNNVEQKSKLLKQALLTVEQFKTGELEDYFNDECVTASETNLLNSQIELPKTAIIYPVLLKNRIELLVKFPSDIKQYKVSVSLKKLSRSLRFFRKKLQQLHSPKGYLTHSKRLYQWLITPILEDLQQQQIDTLVFAPDSLLRTIPMAALHDGKQFLIEQYAISVIPGLTLTEPKPGQLKQGSLLMSALTVSSQGFDALTSVNHEIDAIQQIFPTSLLKDENFLLNNLQQKVSKKSHQIIHISTHGHFDHDVKNTFLLTYDDKLSINQLSQLIGLKKLQGQQVELLTLSACETAAGDDRAALGLAGIAIRAGAKSALASLWKIVDESTPILIQSFYQHLQSDNHSKAKALQQAQLKLLQHEKYQHPGYWSPFLLIGNWL